MSEGFHCRLYFQALGRLGVLSGIVNIGIEVFLGIFIGMALLVLLCIGWHVWRAANENPATAVKKE